MRIFLIGGCAAVGGCLGALAASPVYRLAVPLGAAPRADCPHCHAALPDRWRGWLRLGGRCPACHAPLVAHSWVYVAAPASGFAALAWRLPTRNAAEAVLLVAWLVLTAFGVVPAGIDIAVNRLPRPILATAAAVIAPLVAVYAGCARDPGLAVRAVVVAAAFGGVYLLLALVGVVGMGDVYLAALLGLLLGTGPTASILTGALTPYLLGAPVTAVRLARRRIERGSQIAWGAYLIAGAVLAKGCSSRSVATVMIPKPPQHLDQFAGEQAEPLMIRAVADHRRWPGTVLPQRSFLRL